jgi:hypothetical protein
MHGTNQGGWPSKLTPRQRVEIGIFVEWETWSLAKRKAKERALARARARERPSEIVIPAHEIDLSKVKLKITPEGYRGLQARLEQWAVSLAVLAAYPWFLPRVCIRGGIREWHGARPVLSRDPALPRCSEPHSFDPAVRRASNQYLIADGWRVWQAPPVDDLLIEDLRATQISEPILRPKDIKREVYATARKRVLDRFKVRVSDATIRRCHDLVKESPLPQAEYAPPGSGGVRRHKRADGEQVEHLDARGFTEHRPQRPWWQVREMLSRGQIDEIEFAHAIELGEIFYEAYAVPRSMQFGDDHSPRHANDKHKMLVQTRGGDIRWDDGCRRGRAGIEEEENGEFRLPPCSASLLKIFGIGERPEEEEEPFDLLPDRSDKHVPFGEHSTIDANLVSLIEAGHRGSRGITLRRFYEYRAEVTRLLVWSGRDGESIRAEYYGASYEQARQPWAPRIVDGRFQSGRNLVLADKPFLHPGWSTIAWQDVLDELGKRYPVPPAVEYDAAHPITVYPQGHHTLPLQRMEPVYMRAGGSAFIQSDDDWLEPNRDMARIVQLIGYRSARLLERAIHQDVECDPIQIKDALRRYTWRGPTDGAICRINRGSG